MSGTGRALVGVVLFGLLAVVWAVGVAPSAGPDEPSHVVRSGAVIRGDFSGDYLGASLTVFELPAHIGFPDPGCFAFDPTAPASCATMFDPPEGDARLVTKADSYPIWGHVLPGLGTLAPAEWSGILARVLDALLPVLLIVGSLIAAGRRGWLPAAALTFAITVPLWFAVVVVNPSGLVIAGGIALWTGLLSQHATGLSRLERVLVTAGWVAMALPRRDGLVYAVLIVSAALLITSAGLGDRWRQLGRVGQAAVVVSSVVMMVWAFQSPQPSSRVLLVTPLVPLVAVLGRRWWASFATTPTRVWTAAIVGGSIVIAVSFGVMAARGDGFDSDILQAAIRQTGIDLGEAVGLIGWLDTPVPQSMVFLWFVGLGLLAGAALLVDDRRALVSASLIVVGAIWLSWTLTMLQNDAEGTYWQGRYYLPLLVGVPLLLGHVRLDRAAVRRLGRVTMTIGLLVLTVGFGAGMRRWAVGVNGSLMPWRWDTYDAPIPPILLLWFHVLLAVGIWLWVDGLDHDDEHESRVDDDGAVWGATPTTRVGPGVNVVGYHHVASGLGTVAREMSAALRRGGIHTTDVDVALTNSPQVRDPLRVPDDLRATTVFVVTASELPAVVDSLDSVRAATARSAAYFFWELAEVPSSHVDAARLVDEVWTPTTFVHDAYSAAVTDRAVRLVPVPLAAPRVERGRRRSWRRRLAPDESRRQPCFVFLVSLDLLSIVERKNPFGAIAAFRQAFDGSDEPHVRLVVKTINGDRMPDDAARIVADIGDDDRISVIDEYVGPADLEALIAAADCYVSLHRSEGLGLHLVSAMWSATPVIATDYSGSADLMDASSAALVGYDLVAVERGHDAYPATSQWAEPDIDAAATWMRRLVADPELGRRISAAARRRMETQFEATLLIESVRDLIAATETSIASGQSSVRQAPDDSAHASAEPIR